MSHGQMNSGTQAYASQVDASETAAVGSLYDLLLKVRTMPSSVDDGIKSSLTSEL